ncbi:FecR domain-containing protein [Aestuariibacter sp. AA17]|uniref:FecR domain-containing protein n=1 Tax=Fluctibacter corallii TaxID=2984329 RepID=A0ABT3A9M4_9ALTE|nr:FecR domain-containing protein [Aestuariibacter sp. AA17]MCV2885349.1 FecR domain-containing protein [Aestuariibacter sp. AA17]
MNNIIPINKKHLAREQASSWISKIDRGLRDEEFSDLKKWCEQADLHRELLFEMAELWDSLSALNELSGLFPLDASDERSTAPVSRYGFNFIGFNMATAASLVLVAFIAFLMVPQPSTRQSDFVVKSVEASTSIGEQKPVTLEDGSIIHLNTNSHVNILYTQRSRQIALTKGEAHFDVAHDPNRPFIVTAGNNTVTAVGTAFNVELDSTGMVELLVTEGKVLVKDRGTNAPITTPTQEMMRLDSVLLVSGEKAVIKGEIMSQESVALEYVQNQLAWQQGMLVFEGESLSEILAEVSRYANVSFSLSTKDLGEKRVAGHFKVGDIKGLLFALESSFGIEYVRTAPNEYVLLKKT